MLNSNTVYTIAKKLTGDIVVEEKQTGKVHGQIRREFVLLGILVIAIIVAVIFSMTHKPKPALSYQAAYTNFNNDMADGNTSGVLALESPGFKTALKDGTTTLKKGGDNQVIITNNIYDLAQAEGNLVAFTKKFQSGVRIVIKPYKATNGTVGKAVYFDTKTNYYGAPPYSPSFSLDIIPSGNHYLIDDVNFYAASQKS